MNTKLLLCLTRKLTALLWLLTISPAPAQTAVEAWVRHYDGLIDAQDVGKKVVSDSAGNAIVAGQTDNFITGADFLVIKYSSAGLPLWTNRYNGPANDRDAPNDVLVDASGNVFVTGSSWNGATDDYVTVAYSAAGVPLWTNRYDGAGHDEANAAAVDKSGNLIVSGRSSNDYLTIKYSGAGVPLWTNRYAGAGNSQDLATAVAVDDNGNVFVTGNSGPRDASDIITVAYSAAGVPLWTNQYNSNPGNWSDRANALVVDGGGNVFVTGSTSFEDVGADYITINYSGDGSPLWTNYYSEPGFFFEDASAVAAAVAADSAGNVIVTGVSTTTTNGFLIAAYEFATIKYSGNGVPLWTNRYNDGTGIESGGPVGVLVDANGDVVVVGNSAGTESGIDYTTIKYSSAGVPLWTNRYDGPGDHYDDVADVAVDSSGNVFVTGYSDYDCVTIKYSSAGVSVWTNSYQGLASGVDKASAITVDNSGNVVVTGYSQKNGQATIKYSSAGLPIWTNYYSASLVAAVATDGSDNVVVASASGSGGDRDFATIKYSFAGVPLWTNHYAGPLNSDDVPTSVAMDGNGNVVVAGISFDGNSFDYATVKYSAAGVPLWTNRYDGPGDYLADLAVDDSGNAVVTGFNSDGNGYANTTIKYSPTGVPLWTNHYHGPNHSDFIQTVAVDGSGNVFVAGGSSGGSSNIYSFDFVTIKYSASGSTLWVNRYNEPGNLASAEAIAVDGNGNVVVTGYLDRQNGNIDNAIIKYSATGVPQWTNRFGPKAANWPQAADWPQCVAVDGGGNVFVATTIYDPPGPNNYPFDYLTVAYSSGGVPLWTNRYDGPGHSEDTLAGLAVDSSGNAYVTGRSSMTLSGILGAGVYDFATIKYANPHPRLTIQPDGSGGYFLQVQGIAGTTYRLQRAPDTSGPWSSSSPQTAPPSGSLEFWDIFPPPGQGFYRAVQP